MSQSQQIVPEPKPWEQMTDGERRVEQRATRAAQDQRKVTDWTAFRLAIREKAKRFTPAIKNPDELLTWTAEGEVRAFWKRFGGKKYNGAGFEKTEKLDALKALGVIVVRKLGAVELAAKRQEYKQNRNIHCLIHELRDCFACGSPATCRHHLVELKNGGINHRTNLVSLCDGCHEDLHPWLADSSCETEITSGQIAAR